MSLGSHVPHGKRQGFAQLCGGCCKTAHCNIAGCEAIGTNLVKVSSPLILIIPS